MFWFVLLVLLAFGGEGLGYAACRLVGAVPPQPEALAAFAGVALISGGFAAVLLNWLLIDRHRHLRSEIEDLRRNTVMKGEVDQQATSRLEQQRRLRHDLRGALSPALLTADRLLTHADPKVKRAGEIMVKSVERASSLLIEPDAVSSPPGDP